MKMEPKKGKKPVPREGSRIFSKMTLTEKEWRKKKTPKEKLIPASHNAQRGKTKWKKRLRFKDDAGLKAKSQRRQRATKNF